MRILRNWYDYCVAFMATGLPSSQYDKTAERHSIPAQFLRRAVARIAAATQLDAPGPREPERALQNVRIPSGIRGTAGIHLGRADTLADL